MYNFPLWRVPLIPFASVHVKGVSALLHIPKRSLEKLVGRSGRAPLPNSRSLFFNGGEGLGAQVGEWEVELFVLQLGVGGP